MRSPLFPARDPRWLAAVGLLSVFALTACGASDTGSPGAGDGDDAWVAPADDLDAAGGGTTDGADPGLIDVVEHDVVDVWYQADLTWVTDVPEHVDICDWFDACEDDEAPGDDAGPAETDADDGGPGDGAADATGGGGGADAELADEADVVEGPDDDVVDLDAAADDDAAGSPDPDAAGAPDTVFSECDELGIDDAWAGTFVGVIEYDVETGGLFTPEEGLLSIGGDLTFGITCIDSKLVVKGTLEGFATVQGQGDFPFSINLGGYYDPVTQHLSATMGDGVVSIYGLIEVFFDGVFTGDVNESGHFEGDWTASATGTNQAFVTGDAEGAGTWNAEPAL